MSEDREDRVRQRAHEIWVREGRPHGHEKQHWEQASSEIDAEEGSKPADVEPATGTNPPVEKPAVKRRAATKSTQVMAKKTTAAAKSTVKRAPVRSKS